jgi:hypothetical protein
LLYRDDKSIFLELLDILSKENIIFSVKFCGDGPMRKICQKYGEVLGFVKVKKYLTKSENCFEFFKRRGPILYSRDGRSIC